MTDQDDARRSERAALREEIARLQAEADRLRGTRGAADPEQVARLRAQVGQLAAQNDRLDVDAARRAGPDRGAEGGGRPAGPAAEHVRHLRGPREEGTVEVVSSGRKMRVAVSPSVWLDDLRPGQEVMLNEAFNVVAAARSSGPARS